MFDRFTDAARRALFFARYEASEFGATSIETEHLLLGLLREPRGIAGRLFAGANLTYKDALDQIRTRVSPREKVSISVEIPFSSEVKRALQATAEEADRMLQSPIGPEHMLMGLAREERSMAGTVLAAHGLVLDVIRARAIELWREDKAGADADGEGADHHADSSVGWSIEFANAYQYRALNEHLDRMSHLLVQMASESSERDRVLELIQTLQLELHSLREFLGPFAETRDRNREAGHAGSRRERISDGQASVDDLPVLQVLRVENAASRLQSSRRNRRVITWYPYLAATRKAASWISMVSGTGDGHNVRMAESTSRTSPPMTFGDVGGRPRRARSIPER